LEHSSTVKTFGIITPNNAANIEITLIVGLAHTYLDAYPVFLVNPYNDEGYRIARKDVVVVENEAPEMHQDAIKMNSQWPLPLTRRPRPHPPPAR